MITKFELYQAAALNGLLSKGHLSDVAMELARDIANKMVEDDLRLKTNIFKSKRKCNNV